MAREKKIGGDEAVVIKKYANRRLYNTATSGYVTLDHLARMVKDGVDFVVHDARSGEDITRSVLTQIIVEEEAKGTHLLPVSFLRQLIGFYGDSMQTFVPRYLEKSMEDLASNQKQVREMMTRTFGQMFPLAGQAPNDAVDDLVRNNMAMFRRTMEMFYPEGGSPRRNEAGAAGEADTDGDEIRALKNRIDILQKQLDELVGRE